MSSSGSTLQVKPEPYLEHLHNPPALQQDPTIPTPSENTITDTLNGILEGALPEVSAAKEPAHIDSAKSPEELADHREAKELAHGGLPKEVEDVGWNGDPDHIPDPLVKGLSNDDLWILLRRFNKIYHVRAVEGPLPGDLDLNLSDKEEFSPEKLRASFERLYLTMIVGFAASAKHIARLRSWHERNRTIGWLVAYYTAWLLNMLMPLLFTTLLLLIAFPPARAFLFPPVPLAAVSASSGTLQTPAAGGLHSKDSLTGAPEAYKGEAVEQEASDFVSGMASLAVGTAVGKGPDEERRAREEGDDSVVADPTNIAMAMGDAKEVASGKKAKDNRTKEPMQQAMWAQARPAMRAISDMTDAWEMFGNALSPTPPFSHIIRFKLAGIVLPLLLASLYVNEVVLYKSSSFFFGIAFFGQPMLIKGALWLNEKVPNWQWYMQPKNTLLKGVPTDAQLALTLLRIGEANKTPLPPPPTQGIHQRLPSRPSSPVNAEDLPMDVSQEHVDQTQYDFADHSPTETVFEPEDGNGTPKKQHRIVRLMKGAARGGVSTVLGTDRVKAKVGSAAAKRRLGVLPKPGAGAEAGPTIFAARYEGKKGFVVISTRASTPCVSFSRADPAEEGGVVKPVWSVALGEVRELRRIGGLGFKGRLIVGFALGMQIADGLEVVDALGKTYVLTAMEKRDELFNRLVAIDKQKWECL